LSGLVEKINQSYVLPTLADCFSAIASFDLWMSKGTYDVFALMINFLGND
jgi:endo-1,4-beta-D-glucanase Y